MYGIVYTAFFAYVSPVYEVRPQNNIMALTEYSSAIRCAKLCFSPVVMQNS